MGEAPAYAVLGRGRWAARIQSVLESERRRVIPVSGTRRATTESDAGYEARVRATLAATGAHIAWLCVPPGPHTPVLMRGALEAGLHAVTEKPWRCTAAETGALLGLAREKNAVTAIHYQYCLHDGVEAWRRNFCSGKDLQFGGCFHLNRANPLGIPAEENLGSHLLAVHAFAVPEARVAELSCQYNHPDRRQVWLERAGHRLASLDFLAAPEPLIQRFIARLEAAIAGGVFRPDVVPDFVFDLAFARRVADAVAALR